MKLNIIQLRKFLKDGAKVEIKPLTLCVSVSPENIPTYKTVYRAIVNGAVHEITDKTAKLILDQIKRK